MSGHMSAMDGGRTDSAGDVRPVIAVVGLAGTGKSVVTGILAGNDGHVVYFGGVVLREVQSRGLPLTQEHERAVREELRATEGMNVMATRSLPEITEAVARGQRVIIDGLYSTAELTTLRRALGPGLVTLAVHAPGWLRKQRLGVRPVRPLSPEEVDARDHFELTQLDKAFPIAAADVHVVNDGTVEELSAAVDRVLKERAVRV